MMQLNTPGGSLASANLRFVVGIDIFASWYVGAVGIACLWIAIGIWRNRNGDRLTRVLCAALASWGGSAFLAATVVTNEWYYHMPVLASGANIMAGVRIFVATVMLMSMLFAFPVVRPHKKDKG